jgi:hypothetical protein
MSGNGLKVRFHTASGAAPTLAVDSLAAKAIQVASGVAVGTGVIAANSIWNITYDNSIPAFLLTAVPAAVQDGTVATASIAANAVTHAKLQTEVASRLIGNPTTSTATPTAVPVTGSLFFDGTNLVGGSPRGWIDGLTLSRASSTSIGIAAGVARDSTNGFDITLASAFTKTTSAWAAGTGNGGLDTGAIATSTFYYVWGIYNSSTAVSDVLFSTSSSAPTMPSGYDKKRYIGAVKTDGSSQFIAFTQFGDEFYWSTPILDVNAFTGSTSASTKVLTVPSGRNMLAILNVDLGGGTTQTVYISNLALTDLAPTINGGAAPMSSLGGTSSAGNIENSGMARCWTDTSASIRVRNSANGAVLNIATLGWVDQRGKNA